MQDYRYSSYAAYLSNKETLINKQAVLDWFGGLDGFIDDHKIVIEDLKIE